MHINLTKQVIHALILALCLATLASAARKLEWLDRGLVAIKVNNGVYLSWRVLGTDASSTSFNIYRGTTKVNANPITGATNLTDAAGTTSSTYSVRAIVNGVEQPADGTVNVMANNVLTLNLNRPATGPNGGTYAPNDGSAADLNGDGKLDIVLKWDPSNAKDNSQSGITDDVFLDGITLTGQRLFRINLGPNIRAGAHYTQFVVADFDLDGRAEIIVKTAPGTRDGTGAYLSKGPAANDNDATIYRNANGYVLDGPEYLTVFSGVDGRELATVNYNPGRGTVSSWGDNYGNRVDRFLATAAWLDGNKPSAVMQRGYYTRMAIAAWDWNGTTLTQRWYYNSATGGQQCYGQGNHNVSVGDVDNDGKDEIIQGACAINDDGSFMYRTGLGHGDAMHLGDLDPNRPGLELWQVHEDANVAYGYEMHDARTGQILWGARTGTDNGRGMAADISAAHVGYEMWSSNNNVTTATGTAVSGATKPSVNFRIYWDGDLQDELLDGTRIDKWSSSGISRLVTLGGGSINGTKSNPVLSCDLFGDWREEVITQTATSLIITSTTTPTTHKLYTLMHDPMYRAAISWQNTAYNQPPHLSFFLGSGADKAPVPAIELVRYGNPISSSVTPSSSVAPSSSSVAPSSSVVPSSSSVAPMSFASTLQAEVFCSGAGVSEATNSGFAGTGYFNFNNAQGSSVLYAIRAPSAASTTLQIRYANGGTADRPIRMVVNGTQQQASISFPTTGAWTNWGIVSTTIALTQGVNEIEFSSLTADGGANLDLMGFSIAGITSESCTPVGVLQQHDQKLTPSSMRQYTVDGRWVKALDLLPGSKVPSPILSH